MTATSRFARLMCIVIAALGVGQLQAHAQAPPEADVVRLDLDDSASVWQVYLEGKPKFELKPATEPSLDGASLRCSITGGEPFSNVHCYRNLPADPAAADFHLATSFWFAPGTTCANAGRVPSVVQAIEFSAAKWDGGRRYEWAMQWQNVGRGAPQWRYWDPSRPAKQRWVALASRLAQCLEGNRWHHFTLDGAIEGKAVRYQRFSIDGRTYLLNILVPASDEPAVSDKLAVAVQLDGNARQTPYDVFVDQVHLLAQPAAPGGAACANARLALTPEGPLGRQARVAWSPSGCVMVLQVYQGGQLIREHAQALSGAVNFGDAPPGRTEVKIWPPGATEPAHAVFVELKQ